MKFLPEVAKILQRFFYVMYTVSQFAPRFSGNVLFFGSRSKKKDFFFKEEWDELCAANHLKLFTAFSRDQVCVAFLLFPIHKQ